MIGRLLILGMLVLNSCQCCKTMHCCAFNEIAVGQTVDELFRHVGEPYSIEACEDGRERYFYVKRDQVTADYARQRNFIVVVEDGVVVETDFNQQEYHEIFMQDRNRW